jgi:hypothetical protein
MSDQNLDYLKEIKRREEQVIKDIEEMDSSLNLTEYERKESKDEGEESKDETEKEDEVFDDTNTSSEDAEETKLDEEEITDKVVAEEEPEKKDKDESSSEEGTDYDLSFINELSRRAMGLEASQKKLSEEKTSAVATQDQVAETIEELISSKEMIEAFEDPEKMLSLFKRVYVKAKTDAIEHSLRSLPQVVQPVIAQQAMVMEAAQKFYRDNPDLSKYRDFVQYCAQQIESAHPDWGFEQVFAETAKIARERLPMLKTSQRARVEKPKFAAGQKSTRNKPAKEKLSALELEIASMPDF